MFLRSDAPSEGRAQGRQPNAGPVTSAQEAKDCRETVPSHEHVCGCLCGGRGGGGGGAEGTANR